mmetsp:Transcript_14723/g.28320  ORF Transcript_14723/g.28320 Transcript_14723/m.28320 type:complete len:607 (-) Transcript_14723:253-2073(-)
MLKTPSSPEPFGLESTADREPLSPIMPCLERAEQGTDSQSATVSGNEFASPSPHLPTRAQISGWDDATLLSAFTPTPQRLHQEQTMDLQQLEEYSQRKREERTPATAVTPASAGRRNQRVRLANSPETHDHDLQNIELQPGIAMSSVRQALEAAAEDTQMDQPPSCTNHPPCLQLHSQRESEIESQEAAAGSLEADPVNEWFTSPPTSPGGRRCHACDACQHALQDLASSGVRVTCVDTQQPLQAEQVQQDLRHETRPPTHPPSPDRRVAMAKVQEELACAVCLEICLRPSTAPCGHSFCSSCLATAALSRPVCPKCRKEIPKNFGCPVNTTLWNTIQLLFPEMVKERLAEEAEALEHNRAALSALAAASTHQNQHSQLHRQARPSPAQSHFAMRGGVRGLAAFLPAAPRAHPIHRRPADPAHGHHPPPGTAAASTTAEPRSAPSGPDRDNHNETSDQASTNSITAGGVGSGGADSAQDAAPEAVNGEPARSAEFNPGDQGGATHGEVFPRFSSESEHHIHQAISADPNVHNAQSRAHPMLQHTPSGQIARRGVPSAPRVVSRNLGGLLGMPSAGYRPPRVTNMASLLHAAPHRARPGIERGDATG